MWILVGLASFAVTLLALTLVFRAGLVAGRPIAMLGVVAGVVSLPWLLLVAGVSRLPPSDVFYGQVVYVWCMFAFLTVYYTATTSVSIRIVSEIEAAPRGRLSRAELEACYPPQWMLDRRLADLEAGGLVMRHAGRFVATPRAVVFARFFSIVKSVLNLGTGG